MTKVYSKPLDKYEEELEEFLNKGKLVLAKNQKQSLKEAREAAKNYFELKKSKSVTLRVKNENLIKVKAQAERHNIPYQRLINILIDQYANKKIRIAL